MPTQIHAIKKIIKQQIMSTQNYNNSFKIGSRIIQSITLYKKTIYRIQWFVTEEK